MMSLDEALTNRPIPFDKIKVARLTRSAVEFLCIRCGGATSLYLSMVTHAGKTPRGEELKVRVMDPALAYAFIGQPVNLLE